VDEPMAYILIQPEDRQTFQKEIEPIRDEDLWDIITHTQPTLGLEYMPVFGNA